MLIYRVFTSFSAIIPISFKLLFPAASQQTTNVDPFLIDVGSSTATLAQKQNKIGSTLSVYWVAEDGNFKR